MLVCLQKYKKAYRHTEKPTVTHRGLQTGRKAYRYTEKHRHTERLTDIHTK